MPKVNSGLKPRKPNNFSFNDFLRHRELGKKHSLGFNDSFSRGIYSSLLPCSSWDHNDNLHGTMHGGVFNLEFSPDGSLLVAACEKKSILMFDPLSRKKLECIDNAHMDCVNCVRFLDSRVFATCSDDSTVALWDARNLKSRIRTLHGHSNWVKNIEFSPKDGLLVTSGFDGSIYTWDINSYTERGFVYNRVFRMSGLMRTRLTPDASKMVICTTGGYLIIIHDLDLKTLEQDLAGFKPNMYRLMQLTRTTIPVAANFTNMFASSRKRNRVEFVVDFPAGDDAEVVSSLQVHPQGWCVLSRNISSDENSEWSCVHDIQDSGRPESEDEDLELDFEHGDFVEESFSRQVPQEEEDEEDDDEDDEEASAARSETSTPSETSRLRAEPHFAARGPSGQNIVVQRRFSPNIELQLTTADVWEAMVAVQDARNSRLAQERLQMGSAESAGAADAEAAGPAYPFPASADRTDAQEAAGSSEQEAAEDDSLLPSMPPRPADWQGQVTRSLRNAGRLWQNLGSGPDGRAQPVENESRRFLQLSPYNLAARTVLLLRESRFNGGRTYSVPPNHRIHRNRRRLTHFVQEPNVGRGFIKELCFSPDGRIICSPFGYGVRLLTFNPECSELAHCAPEVPTMLFEQRTNVCHGDIVVSTKFSPVHCLLVSGCLSGKIVWHQPQP